MSRNRTDVQIATPSAQPHDVRPLRELYRKEMNCQIVHDSWHGRGWTDGYLLQLDGRTVGYGLVGGVRAKRKTIVIEFYVLPDHRAAALPLFRAFAAASGARRVETQTNDFLLTLMAYDCARRLRSDVILFHDALTTRLAVRGAKVRRSTDADKRRAFAHASEPVGDWVVEAGGVIAATGGILFHYNVPYGDIYMEVAPDHRRRGYGSYLVQELKRACYELGKVPAARCNATNAASRATLQKAGMHPCARMLSGILRR